jgi:hypothetical protein
MSVGFLYCVVDTISLVNLAVRFSKFGLRFGAKQICACTVEDDLPVKLNHQAKFQLYCSLRKLHIPVRDQTTTSNYKDLRMGWPNKNWEGSSEWWHQTIYMCELNKDLTLDEISLFICCFYFWTKWTATSWTAFRKRSSSERWLLLSTVAGDLMCEVILRTQAKQLKYGRGVSIVPQGN